MIYTGGKVGETGAQINTGHVEMSFKSLSCGL